MRSWPIQNKEDLDKTKGNLTQWVEIMFLETFLHISVASLKPSQIKKGWKISSCTKSGIFFFAASCKKDTIFGAARQIFDPS